jgi:hypothetical protein
MAEAEPEHDLAVAEPEIVDFVIAVPALVIGLELESVIENLDELVDKLERVLADKCALEPVHRIVAELAHEHTAEPVNEAAVEVASEVASEVVAGLVARLAVAVSVAAAAHMFLE